MTITGGTSWVPGTAEVLEFRLAAGAGGTLVSGTAYVNGTMASYETNEPVIPDVDNQRATTYLGYAAQPRMDADYQNYCGQLGEMIVFSKALTDADRRAVEMYLTTRWQL